MGLLHPASGLAAACHPVTATSATWYNDCLETSHQRLEGPARATKPSDFVPCSGARGRPTSAGDSRLFHTTRRLWRVHSSVSTLLVSPTIPLGPPRHHARPLSRRRSNVRFSRSCSGRPSGRRAATLPSRAGQSSCPRRATSRDRRSISRVRPAGHEALASSKGLLCLAPKRGNDA